MTAYVLEQQRRREEEEAPAAAFNANQRAMDAAYDAQIAAAVLAREEDSNPANLSTRDQKSSNAKPPRVPGMGAIGNIQTKYATSDGVIGIERMGDAVSVANLEREYGITTHGLNFQQRLVVATAARLTGEKLALYIGESPGTTFRVVHGPIIIFLDPNRTTCETVGSSITCDGDSILLAAMIHEFGHVFDNRYNSLTNDTNYVGESIGASGYVPLEWNGDPSGYKCLIAPCMAHSLQAYPNLPHGLNEEFADMYLNWVLDETNIDPAHMGFTHDGLGPLRRDWMNRNMPIFLQRMGLTEMP